MELIAEHPVDESPESFTVLYLGFPGVPFFYEAQPFRKFEASGIGVIGCSDYLVGVEFFEDDSMPALAS